MEVCFSQLCYDRQLCSALQKHIDLAGSHGQSYEFPKCRMPEGCVPSLACVGFFRRVSGAYVLYWRPQVVYHGTSKVLTLFFRQCLWSFDSYEQLAARLHSLRTELPAPMKSWSYREPAALASAAAPTGRAQHSALRSHRFSTMAEATTWPASFKAIQKTLAGRILGQESAVMAAAYYLYSFLGKVTPSRPLSLILHGPTGVGKSELAKSIAPILEKQTGKRWQFIWTELNTFTQSHSVHRLTGAPPGYVGYEDEPILSAVRKNPQTVFMFDELDKAHPDVWRIFMSILDEGRCSVNRVSQDGQRELNYRKCIFLFTTNLDLSSHSGHILGFSSSVADGGHITQKGTAATPEDLAQQLFMEDELGRKALIRHGVLQEIAGRFTGFIGFQPLTKTAQLQILAQKAVSLGREYGLCITSVSPEAAWTLLPDGDVTSIRSAICLLEAKLAPVYQQASGGTGASYHLITTDGTLSLRPVSAGIQPLVI